MEIQVLGPVRAVSDDATAVDFAEKQAAVLTILALAGPQGTHKESLLAGAWPEPPRANALESVISRVRTKLGGTRQVIGSRNTLYWLALPTDVQRFRDLSNRARSLSASREGTAALELIDQAHDVWRGRLRTDWLFGEALAAAEGLLRQRQELTSMKIECLSNLQRWSDVVAVAEEALREDQYLESMAAIRARARAKAGDPRRAGIELRKLLETWESEGVVPSPALMDLCSSLADTSPLLVLPGELERMEERDPSQTAQSSVDHNLPARTGFVRFVERQREWAALEQALSDALPVAGVVGIGGTGKTTLVREFARRLADEGERFKLIVWVSDRSEPGSTVLASLLHEVARTAGSPGLAAQPTARQLSEIDRLLKNVPALIVVDNYDTVEDPLLRDWVARVPPPSKVFLTTIERDPLLDECCRWIEVNGFTPRQCEDFVAQLLERRGKEPVLNRSWYSLTKAAAGNARLIDWGVGQVLTRGVPVDSLVASIQRTVAATEDGGSNDIVLREIFRSSWENLKTSEMRILTALACFPHGLDQRAALDVAGNPARAMEAIAHLVDLCFVSILQEPGYERPLLLIDPLVSRRSLPRTAPHARDIEQNWMDHWIRLAASVGFCPDQVERLNRLDGPGCRENLEFAIRWAFENERYDTVVQICRDVRYFYYVRGFWSTDPNPHLLRAEAARALGAAEEEFDARVYYLNIAAKQENGAAVREQTTRIHALLADPGFSPTPESLARYRHARALALLAERDYEGAEHLWRQNLEQESVLGPADYNANLRWLAICLERQGGQHLEESRELFDLARSQAEEQGYRRVPVFIDLEIARMALKEDAPRESLLKLEATLSSAEMADRLRVVDDRKAIAEHAELLGLVLARLGELSRARPQLAAAVALLDRLGSTDRSHRLTLMLEDWKAV